MNKITLKKTSLNKLSFSILVLLFTCIACVSGDEDSEVADEVTQLPPRVSIFTRENGTATVGVELARTQQEQLTGLMNRDELGEFQGLLFLFSSSAVRNFTMESTFIPLDIIFIDSDFRVIGIVENTIPDTPGPFGISSPSMYALEVNAGFSDRRGIQIGDAVAFSGFEF